MALRSGCDSDSGASEAPPSNHSDDDDDETVMTYGQFALFVPLRIALVMMLLLNEDGVVDWMDETTGGGWMEIERLEVEGGGRGIICSRVAWHRG